MNNELEMVWKWPLGCVPGGTEEYQDKSDCNWTYRSGLESTTSRTYYRLSKLLGGFVNPSAHSGYSMYHLFSIQELHFWGLPLSSINFIVCL